MATDGLLDSPLTPIAGDLDRLAARCTRLPELCEGVALRNATGDVVSFGTEARKGVLDGVRERGVPADRLTVEGRICCVTETAELGRHDVGAGAVDVHNRGTTAGVAMTASLARRRRGPSWDGLRPPSRSLCAEQAETLEADPADSPSGLPALELGGA